MAGRVLTEELSVPLRGVTAAKIDISTGAGNLTIDRLGDGEQLLASGTLEYPEKQAPPTPNLEASDGRATLTLSGQGAWRGGFHMPWQACTAAYEWRIHLNPTVRSDITAHSGGGNVRLDLADMAVTRLAADSGGGNMDVALPDNAADLSATIKTGAGNVGIEIGSGTTGSNTVDASSGAGNVAVRVPGGMAARIHATSGMGKVIVDPRFSKLDRDTYQSADYDSAANRVELTLKSGAGNVSVNTK